MNKVLVREITKNDSTFGFELERQDNRVSPNRKKGDHSKEENSVIVVQCESETQRDEWLKTINDQVFKTSALDYVLFFITLIVVPDSRTERYCQEIRESSTFHGYVLKDFRNLPPCQCSVIHCQFIAFKICCIYK